MNDFDHYWLKIYDGPAAADPLGYLKRNSAKRVWLAALEKCRLSINNIPQPEGSRDFRDGWRSAIRAVARGMHL